MVGEYWGGHTLTFDPDKQSVSLSLPEYVVCDMNNDWIKTYRKGGDLIVEVEPNAGGLREFYGLVFSPKIRSKTGSEIFMEPVKATQIEAVLHTPKEHKAALIEFYNQCNGTEWTYQENWCSDKHLWEWSGVNEVFRSDYVVSLNFGKGQYNGLKNMLPESFTVLMDDAWEINLSNGSLSGAFPYKITHHPRWNEFGWNFIQQNPWYGGRIDYTDINLKLPDEEVWNFKEGKSSTLTELKKHKLTWLIHTATNGENWADIVNPERINLWLDYAPKGLGLTCVNHFRPRDDFDKDEYLKNIQNLEAHGVPKDWNWVDHFIEGKGLGGNGCGNMSVFDSDGNLIWHSENDYDMNVAEGLNDIFRKILGDPVAHDPYVPEPSYTSTDYSEDGKLIVLQKAEIGKGIDVILMGDGFTDRDMDDDGRYIQQMREANEWLFSIEPLRSLRNRFNVYAIKVVSPNEYVANGKQTLNQNADKCAEYVSKVLPDVNFAESHTCIIENKANDFFVSGYTAMCDEGGSFAVLDQGAASNIIIHEVGGHGFGKLLDEYVYSGYEDNHTQPGAEEAFKQWIKTDYHDKGWGLNLSTTDVANMVQWVHMLDDDDCSTQVGIYKGAWYWPEELWRSTENSMMNSDYSFFNAPSREAIYKYVMKASEGDSWTFDFETFKAWDMNIMQSASRKVAPEKKDARQIRHNLPRKIVKKEGKYVVETSSYERFLQAPKPIEKHRVTEIERDGHKIRLIGL